jgi:hypothetical protein
MTYIELDRVDGQMYDDPTTVNWENVHAAFLLHLMIDLGPNTESVVIKPDRITITRIQEDEHGHVVLADGDAVRQVTEVFIRYPRSGDV